MQDGFVRVVSDVCSSDLAKAGIKPGDLIVKLDDTPVKGLSLSDAVDKMRGEPGTKIKLTIVREGDTAPRVVDLTRETISVKSVRGRMLDNGLAYLRISSFTTETGASLDKVFAQLQKDSKGEIKGIDRKRVG